MRIGVHISGYSSLEGALLKGKELGCNTIQIFSRNPRSWASKNLNPTEVEKFKIRRKSVDISPVVIHIPYLANISSPENEIYQKSINAFKNDVKNADIMSAEYFVFHPGSHKGAGEEIGISRISSALKQILSEVNPSNTMILLENTCGSGNLIGETFEQIGEIIKRVNDKRLGLCFDTCHAFSAGYNWTTQEGLEDVLKKIDKYIGLEKLKVIHTNDSKGEFNSHTDRHEHIGKGYIGKEPFRLLLNHSRLLNLPFILETPKKTDKDDKMNLKTIKSLIS